MRENHTKLLTVVSAGAAIALGAIGAAVGQQYEVPASISGPGMSTGVTIIQSTAPAALDTSVAVPSITGPAPLPPEEQGLPGS